MLINLSNHPSDKWSEGQTMASRQYGEVVDLPFPQVDPEADTQSIQLLAEEYLAQIQQMANPTEAVIHIMGELNLTYALVNLLKAAGYTCVASTSTREVYEDEPGKKTVFFKFVRFREY